MITLQNVHKYFGGVQAVRDVSFVIADRSITGLIGPNGAGKTTLFNVIAGHYAPTAGTISLAGDEIGGLQPHELFAAGLLRTFQIAHEFSTLTVRENLMMVPPEQPGECLTDVWFRPSRVRLRERAIRDQADGVLDFLKIGHVADELAGNLSGGQKKLLELGRTMMVEAKIVFLDEVGAGVNKSLLRMIEDSILRLRNERGYTFCVIEHDMEFISRLCDHVVCMAEGAVMAEGTPDQILSNDAVIEAYLGDAKPAGAAVA